jgi:hypothetical protein
MALRNIGSNGTTQTSVYAEPEFIASLSFGAVIMFVVLGAHVMPCFHCLCKRKRRATLIASQLESGESMCPCPSVDVLRAHGGAVAYTIGIHTAHISSETYCIAPCFDIPLDPNSNDTSGIKELEFCQVHRSSLLIFSCRPLHSPSAPLLQGGTPRESTMGSGDRYLDSSMMMAQMNRGLTGAWVLEPRTTWMSAADSP